MRQGRPKSLKARKKSEKIFVNLTERQKREIAQLSEKEDLSLSQVCVKALKNAGYIT